MIVLIQISFLYQNINLVDRVPLKFAITDGQGQGGFLIGQTCSVQRSKGCYLKQPSENIRL